MHICAHLGLSILIQFRIPFLGSGATYLPPHILPPQCNPNNFPTDMCVGLLDFPNPSLRLSSKEMLDCINLTIKSCYHIPVYTDVKGKNLKRYP